jgi:hypothetical protein
MKLCSSSTTTYTRLENKDGLNKVVRSTVLFGVMENADLHTLVELAGSLPTPIAVYGEALGRSTALHVPERVLPATMN